MKLVNEKLGIDAELKEDFTQSQFEKYQTALITGTESAKVNSVMERVLVQAAIDSGILTGIKTPLQDAKAKVVHWLTVKVDEFIRKESEIPQE